MEIDKLTITISPTADGEHVYVQIASPAAAPVNIVLIAEVVEVNDSRAKATRETPVGRAMLGRLAPPQQSIPKRKRKS